MLVGIGVLLLVIEVVALGNGLALARSITTSVDELFSGTERVKSGNFEQRDRRAIGRPARAAGGLVQRHDGPHPATCCVEQDEKRRLEEELQIARDIQMSLLPQGALKRAGHVGRGAVRAGARGGRRLLRLPAAGRRPHRPADRRRLGKGHVGGALHGRAEGADAVAQPHSHVAARAADRGQRDHREPSRQPQLHHDDLCGGRSRGGHADVRARRAYAVHAHRRRGRAARRGAGARRHGARLEPRSRRALRALPRGGDASARRRGSVLLLHRRRQRGDGRRRRLLRRIAAQRASSPRTPT